MTDWGKTCTNMCRHSDTLSLSRSVTDLQKSMRSPLWPVMTNLPDLNKSLYGLTMDC